MSEFVIIVDEEDRITKFVTRKEMRVKGLRHRGTAILVFNSKGQLFVHKRTAIKDMFPGFYDIAVGGVVESEETYISSAKRELTEELGIVGVELKYLFKTQYESEQHKCYTVTYACLFDGPIILQEDEIEEGFFLAYENIEEFVNSHNICPDSKLVWDRFWNKYQQDWQKSLI